MPSELFHFPPFSDRPGMERKCCELLNKYRNGVSLPPEVLDWMDSANAVLDTASGGSLDRSVP